MTTADSQSSSGAHSRFSCVDSPAYTKKIGTRTPAATGSMRRASSVVNRTRGIAIPRRNDAKMACAAMNPAKLNVSSMPVSTMPSITHAKMSLVAPAVSARVPSRVRLIPRSSMMRASTGNAVTDMAAPR